MKATLALSGLMKEIVAFWQVNQRTNTFYPFININSFFSILSSFVGRAYCLRIRHVVASVPRKFSDRFCNRQLFTKVKVLECIICQTLKD